ncbi:hypothetical protein [Mangrovicoccus sp. HB161399]|uniref:CIS tube protein n=1 Tax=Mangrovicoccus sp. HB161399 TaxID=2720392 RepID=UPI001551B73F|nr:hypothetical protein [Mangrovicoccus sp. HB161399]
MTGFVQATISPATDAKGKPLTGPPPADKVVTVHFNPEKLDIRLTNNLKKGKGKQAPQLISEATAQLSAELVFDTSGTGVDVRQHTGKLAAFLEPGEADAKEKGAPQIVKFEWGTIAFEGYIDSYSESLDFFSENGVPLRASVSLSLTQSERSFKPKENAESAAVGGASPFGSSSPLAPATGDGAQADAAAAEANGLENSRFPDAAQVETAPGGGLGRPPAAFAAAGAGLSAGIGGGVSAGVGGSAGISAGLSGGISAGVSGGLSAGISGGISGGASAGFSAGVSGGAGLSAGVSGGVSAGLGGGISAGLQGGTAAAFSGLSVRGPSVSASFSKSAAAPPPAGAAGGVQLGGRASASAGASFAAPVGRGTARITYQGD